MYIQLFPQLVDFDLQPFQGLPQLVKRLTALPQKGGSDPDATGSGGECRSAEQQGADHGQMGQQVDENLPERGQRVLPST